MRIGLAFLLAFILLAVLIPLSVLRSPPVSRPVESPSHITQEVQGEASSAPVTTTRPVADAESFAIYNTATSKVETVSVQDYVRGAVGGGDAPFLSPGGPQSPGGGRPHLCPLPAEPLPPLPRSGDSKCGLLRRP